VVRAFGSDAPELTHARIAERTGLTRANVRRVLLTLMELGYVEQEGKVFRLRPGILDLGYAYLSSTPLPRLAQPVMEDLVARLRLPCNLSVLDGNDVIVIGRVTLRRTGDIDLALNIGRRFPAYVTPMGRLLLAGLPEAELTAYLEQAPLKRLTARTLTDPAQLRRALEADLSRGWSLVDREQSELICSIAVPVTNSKKEVVATLSVGWPSGEITEAEVETRLLPLLREAGAEVSRFIVKGSHSIPRP
jgi:IclR family pca regulon transcriptional regulator